MRVPVFFTAWVMQISSSWSEFKPQNLSSTSAARSDRRHTMAVFLTKSRKGAGTAGIMEALRQSVKAEGGEQSSPRRPQSKKGKRRIEGQREMLLPITGKKDKETAAKSTARSTGRHKKAG